MNMKAESAGHFLDGFGIFGPSRIQPRSFKAKIQLLQDFDFRFAQTTSTTHPGTLAGKEGCIINLYRVTRIPEFRKSGISENAL